MGGPVYRYDAAPRTRPSSSPQSLDGRFFAGEYGRRWIKAIEVNADGTPGRDLGLPVDRHAGHGHGLRPRRRAVRARLRHRHATTRRSTGSSTSAAATAARSPRSPPNKTSGPAPLTVNFSSAGSSDPEGGALTYSWTFGDGTTSTAANPTQDLHHQRHLHADADRHGPGRAHRHGERDHDRRQHRARRYAHHRRPTASCSPSATPCPFQVTVTDPEDGTIDCSRVTRHLLARPRQPRATRSPRKTGCSRHHHRAGRR